MPPKPKPAKWSLKATRLVQTMGLFVVTAILSLLKNYTLSEAFSLVTAALGSLATLALLMRATDRVFKFLAELDPQTSIPRGLQILELLIPKRLREEDMGDALEMIQDLRDSGASRWKITLKVLSTMGWVGLNALNETVSKLRGIFKPGKEK